MKRRKTTYSLVCAMALSLAAAPIISSVTHQAFGNHYSTTQVHAATNVNDYIANQNFGNPAITTYASTFTQDFAYRNGVGQPEGIVIHETANPNSTIDNEIAYMQREWSNIYAYVHAFVDHSRVINIHPTDYGVWGAGPAANSRFIQIELVREHSLDDFARSVNNDAYYVAYLLRQYNLPCTLADNTGSGTIWSHNAVSNYLGGTDHTDPVGYFAQWGYDMNQFYQLVQKKYNELGGGSSEVLDTVVSSQGENSYGQVNGNNINGTYILTSQGFKYIKMSSAYDGQVFRISQSAVTNKGVTMYEMADENKKGLFWVIASQVDVLGDWHAVPGATQSSANGVFTVTTNGRGAAVLTAPGGLNWQARFLGTGSSWKVNAKAVTSDGQTYYQVGTNNWVAATAGSFKDNGTPAPAEKPTTSALSGVVRITNGNGTTIYTQPKGSATARKLGAGSAWKVFEQAVFKSGETWYRVSPAEWILASDAQLQDNNDNNSQPSADTVYQNVNTVATVTAGGGTTLKRAPGTGNDAGRLNGSSRWKVNQVAILPSGQVWYLVGTNQWLNGQDATLSAGAIFNLGGVATVGGSSAALTNDAGQATGNTLAAGSRWKVTGLRTQNGQAYYRVATNTWLPATSSSLAQ